MYRTIMVGLDNSASAAGRVESAIDVGKAFEAALVGVYAEPTLTVPVMADAAAPAIVIEAQLEAIAADRDAATKMWNAAVEGYPHGASLDVRVGTADHVLMEVARTVDLCILGRHDPEDDRSLPRGIVEHLLLDAGGPVLVLPPGRVGAKAGKPGRVIVAWNGSREAARAVHDAMGFMSRATKVEILTVEDEPEENPELMRSARGIADSIARHGVVAEVMNVKSEGFDTGDRILTHVDALGADLVVMGAYGHSRLRELVLGGATLSALEDSGVPVLFSH